MPARRGAAGGALDTRPGLLPPQVRRRRLPRPTRGHNPTVPALPYTHALHPIPSLTPPTLPPIPSPLPRLSFYADVTAAFPELALYVVTRAENKFGQTDISSGVTSQDEYLRTVGGVCPQPCHASGSYAHTHT